MIEHRGPVRSSAFVHKATTLFLNQEYSRVLVLFYSSTLLQCLPQPDVLVNHNRTSVNLDMPRTFAYPCDDARLPLQ
jgi:hypothetical protein